MSKNYAYKVGDHIVSLEADPSVVAVRFNVAQRSERAGAVRAAGVGPFTDRFEVPGEKLTLVPTATLATALPPSGDAAFGALNALNRQPEVSHALPVFRMGGNQVIASDRIVIGIDDAAAGAAIVARYGLNVLQSEDDRLLAQVPDGADPFALATAIDGGAGVRFAEPDLITIGRHVPKRVASPTPSILSDPLVPRQYAMTITQATAAWAIQTGDPKIRIAILDEGVHTGHPDLAAAVVGAFDAMQGDSDQEPNRWDGHGTACAGLAAARGDTGIGVRGVAAGASLLAVRIAYSTVAGGPWVTSNSQIRNGIQWAWQNGADVLSNSWGGGAPSNDISDAFAKARKFGRNGRGAVVVIAAGNSFFDVSFPGTLADVLTVSASNEYDEAKTPVSRDGEGWWGTNHGPQVDIAAPGVHNMTTDIGGAGGYTPDDYTPNFNGTSSSTPIVAGACALVLSANPSLTGSEVAEILVSTADKVGQYPYAGGRNDYFGAGRLNVLAAVRRAQALLSA